MFWVAVLARHPGAVASFVIPARDGFVPALGLSAVLAVIALARSRAAGFESLDRILFFLAAAPGALLFAGGMLSAVGLRPSPLFSNAGWGVLLTFPGVMLAGSSLVRHRVLPRWNQLPALGGFALPIGVIARVAFHAEKTALGLAMSLALAWAVLGWAAATRRTA